MDNSINFKGAFLIKQAKPELRNRILQVLEQKKKGKQIIEMPDNGDVLYVVRKSFDKGISDVLLDKETKNVKFKYYPTLNTKCGFDDEKPLEAKKILRTAANKVINTKQKLELFFKQKIKKPIDIVTIQANNLKTIQKFTYTDVTGNNYRTNIDHQSGICTIYSMTEKMVNGEKRKIRHTFISITPPDQYGISYARINPVLLDEGNKMRRLAIKNGEVIFEYNEPGSKTFIKNEAAAKKHYIDTIKKYKSDLAAYKE